MKETISFKYQGLLQNIVSAGIGTLGDARLPGFATAAPPASSAAPRQPAPGPGIGNGNFTDGANGAHPEGYVVDKKRMDDKVEVQR